MKKLLIIIPLIISFSCTKKQCWNCIAQNASGAIIATVQTCDVRDRDGFLNNYSAVNANCTLK